MPSYNIGARYQYLQTMCSYTVADNVLDEDLESKSAKLVIQLNGQIQQYLRKFLYKKQVKLIKKSITKGLLEAKDID